MPIYYKYVRINVILQVKYKGEIYIFISTDNINTSYTIIDTIFAMASRQHNMLTQAAGGRALILSEPYGKDDYYGFME